MNRNFWISIVLTLFLSVSFSYDVNASDTAYSTDGNRGNRQFEVFVLGLADLFNSTGLDDPERVKAILRVTLAEQQSKARGYRYYFVFDLPVNVSKGIYEVRQAKDGSALGTLRLWIDPSVSCLTAEGLKELTKIDFKRSLIHWHSRDLREAGWIDQYVASKPRSEKSQAIFSAKLTKQGCIGQIELN